SLLQVRQFPENLKAPFDLLPGQGLQALRAEALHRKRSHDSSVEQGALEDLTVQLCLRSNVAHKASGEGISRAGGISDFLNGKSGGAEGMASDAECAFAEENSRAVFAVLDHQCFRPHGDDFLRGPRKVCFMRQHLGFGVINQQHVDQFEGFGQFLGSAVDPIVHRVTAGEPYMVHVPAHVRLQRWLDVGQEQEISVFVFFGNTGLECLEYVEIGIVRFGFVEIIDVRSAPAEGLPFGALEPARVDPMLLKNFLLFGAEVFAHDSDYPDLREVAGCEREIGGSASQNVLYAAGGRGDVIVGYRTDHKYAHAFSVSARVRSVCRSGSRRKNEGAKHNPLI